MEATSNQRSPIAGLLAVTSLLGTWRGLKIATMAIFQKAIKSRGKYGRTVAERDVVITGLGIVSPIGVGRQAVWDSIVARRSGVRMQPALEAAGWLAPFNAEVADFDPKELIQPRKS